MSCWEMGSRLCLFRFWFIQVEVPLWWCHGPFCMARWFRLKNRRLNRRLFLAQDHNPLPILVQL